MCDIADDWLEQLWYKLGGISLSEVSAETIHEAVKHTKIAAVEVELSMYVVRIVA